MYIYIIIISIGILFCYINSVLKDTKAKKYFEIFMIIVLALLAGLRYQLGGTDYYVYKITYNNTPTVMDLDINDEALINSTFGMESGYIIYNSIFNTLNFSYNGFLLINSLIFYIAMYVILRKRINNFNFFIIFFIYKMMLYDTYVSLRQPIAMLIFWYSIKFIENRNMIKYLICCIIAMLFHSSAIVLFLVYFVYKINFTKKIFIMISILGIIFYLLSVSGMFTLNPSFILEGLFEGETNTNKLSGYFDDTGSDNISLLNIIELYLIVTIVVLNYDKINDEKNKMNIVALTILIICFMFFNKYIIVTRLRDYFMIYYIIILERYMKINPKSKNLIITIVITLSTIGFFRYVYLFDNGHFANYKSIVENNISIFKEN